MSERLSRERLAVIKERTSQCAAKGRHACRKHGFADATDAACFECELLAHIAALEAEVERLRETNKRLNRRCSKAEAIANKSIEQLRNEGQRNFGRMLANYAAAHYMREVERLQKQIEAAKAAVMECAWEPRCDALAALDEEVGE